MVAKASVLSDQFRQKTEGEAASAMRLSQVTITSCRPAGIAESGRIAVCLRDIHAATQYIGLNLANDETSGRVLLGLEPRTPRF